MTPTRRSIVAVLAWALAAIPFAGAAGFAPTRGDIVGRVRRLFGRSGACARLARQASLPVTAELEGALAGALGQPAASAGAWSDTALLGAIETAIRSDYRQGRVADLEGWQVSATELLIIRSLA